MAPPSGESGPQTRRIPFPAGDLAVHVSGRGEPVLLLHGVHPAASSAEMAPLAARLARRRKVYNLDLPGFGFSERSDVHYDIPRFVAAVEAAATFILEQDGAERLDAVALSLSCEFLARAALRKPRRHRSLAFISPTGFEAGSERLVEPQGSTFERPWASRLLATPLGSAVFRMLARPGAVRWLLRRAFGRGQVDPALLAEARATVLAPGAEHAPLAFLSGRLHGRDVSGAYRALTMPVFMAHGVRGVPGDFSGAAWTAARSNWTVRGYDTGALPHVEEPGLVSAHLIGFLDEAVDEERCVAPFLT